MNRFDTVLKVDWSSATYIGDGVYVMRVDGDVALRTDREDQSHVIVLEPKMLEELNEFDQKTKGQQGQRRPMSHLVEVTTFDPQPQEPPGAQDEIRIDAPVGLIPVGAKLEHHTHWLEMIGTHKRSGFDVHPLTISLPDETVNELNASGHTGNWILRRIEGKTAVVAPEPTET